MTRLPSRLARPSSQVGGQGFPLRDNPTPQLGQQWNAISR